MGIIKQRQFLFHVKLLAKELEKLYITMMEPRHDSLTLLSDGTFHSLEAWNKELIIYLAFFTPCPALSFYEGPLL